MNLSERARQTLERVVEKDSGVTGDPNRRSLNAALLALGKPVTADDFINTLDRIYYRHDCTDFDMNVLLRMMYLYAESPLLEEKAKTNIKAAFLDYDYWIHKNNKNAGKQLYWTENHVMQYVTAEYLIAQMYPDETFRMREMKGSDIVPLIRVKVLDWIRIKGLTGFCEWNSNCYADENFHALLNLYDFAQDDEVVEKAKGLLDVMMFEMSVNSYKGRYCCTHGRAYDNHVLSTRNDNTAAVQAMAWGLGEDFTVTGSVSGLAFATTTYEIPDLINEIALDDQSTIETRSQQSFDVEDGPALGKGFEDDEDLTLYWHNMGYTHINILENVVEMEKKYNINVNQWPNREYNHHKECLEKGIDPPVCRCPNYLSRVNILTYKTPDYLISCAQDFRKGGHGFQQHIWQATLDDEAIVFTNHPGRYSRPSYWAGNDIMPRAVQFKNCVISLFDIHKESYYNFTHAFFPKAEFDEVCELGGWIFGRKNDGYVALYSQNGYRWSDEEAGRDREVICDSRQNVWVCQMGRKTDDGSFEQFVVSTLDASLVCEGLDVEYTSSYHGSLSFGWDAELKHNGEAVQISDYRRIENPFGSADYLVGDYAIQRGEKRMIINLG